MNSQNHPALQFENVVRTFHKGKFLAVNGVSLDVQPGEVHSIIGPNGAGKTTLVKMAATILNPSSGHVFVNGVDTVKSPSEARRGLGLVIGGELGFYPRATAQQNLRFFADLAGVSRRNLHAEVARVLDAVVLSDRVNDRVNTFSRGMVQRLHIARALLGEPSLLIMDEPTNGLDPDIALAIRSMVKKLVHDGHAVVLTSHTMSEIEDLSSRISVIGAGRIHVSGSLADILAHAGVSTTTTFTIHAADAKVLDRLAEFSDIKSMEKSPKGAHWAVTVLWKNPVNSEDAQLRMREAFTQCAITIPVDVVSRPSTLEEAYVALAGELKR